MSDQQRPNLSLGQPPGNLKKLGRFPTAWLWVFGLLHVAALVCLLMLLLRPAGGDTSEAVTPAAGNPQQLRDIALKLEEKSLYAPAARAWEDYLAAAPQEPQRAEILYRIGKFYMQAQRYDEAAATLVRSEMAAAGDKKLTDKIGPKLIECLRLLGMYGEVGRELSRRVEATANEPKNGKVIATLAGESLTEADLDRMIERRVDRMLALQGAPSDPAARDAVLRQLSSPAMRRQMLQEMIQTELFCRRARELKLDQQEEFLQAQQFMVQDLLAGRFLARELEKIQPTDVDLESYYKANQKDYEQPESIRVIPIRLAENEDAAELLAGIESADDFRKLADDRKTAEGQTTRRLVRGSSDPLLGPADDLFEIPPGQWTKEPHANGNEKYLVLVQQKTPARTPSLEEVKSRVRADYAARKQRELSEHLFRDLTARYNVRIMAAEEAAKDSEKKAAEPDEEETP